MQFPILILPSATGSGFSASVGAPFNLTANAPTAEEVERKITEDVKQRLAAGQIRWISFGGFAQERIAATWLPDDETTRDWLENIREFREQCDRGDRERIEAEDMEIARGRAS